MQLKQVHVHIFHHTYIIHHTLSILPCISYPTSKVLNFKNDASIHLCCFLDIPLFDPFRTSHTSHDITRIPLSCWPPDARLFARRVACSKSKSSTPCKGDLPKRKAGRKNRSCEKMDENGLMMLAWLILTVHIFFGLFFSTLFPLSFL